MPKPMLRRVAFLYVCYALIKAGIHESSLLDMPSRTRYFAVVSGDGSQKGRCWCHGPRPRLHATSARPRVYRVCLMRRLA